MDLKHIQGWAEDHPFGTAAIIIGGGLLLLYFLGVFSKGSAGGSASAGNPGLAQAYYAAEAAQAAGNTQLMIAQTNASASTAQAQISANAATAINANNNSTAAAINAKNAETQAAISTYQGSVDLTKFLVGQNDATAVELNSLNQHGFAVPITASSSGFTFG